MYIKNVYLLTIYVAMYGNDAMIMGLFIGYQLVFLLLVLEDHVVLPTLIL